jgi:zinc protease
MLTTLTLLATVALAKSKKEPAPPPPPPPVVEALPVPPPVPVDPLAERPAIGAATPWSVPVPEADALPNGASLWVMRQPSLPLVSVVLTVPAGSAADTPKGAGVQWLTDRMLTQGAAGRDAAAFAAAVETLGATIDVSTGRTTSSIQLTVRRENLGAALDLMRDMVVAPSFDGKVAKRERSLAISSLVVDREDPVTVATRLAWARWYGDGHPYANPTDGTEAGLRKAGKGALRKRWTQTWHATGASFTVAGDITRDEAKALLAERFGAWEARPRAERVVAPPPAHGNAPVVLVDNPGAAQTMFMLVFPGPALGAPESAPARVGTIVLGGTFTSRLNALLREKRGYTYGVRARTEALPGAGALVVSTRIRTDATGAAMKDLLAELQSIRAGITPAELTKATAAYRQDLVETMETRAGVAGTFAAWQSAGKGPDALTKELQATEAVTLESVTAAMAAYDPAKAVIVLVGDRARIQTELANAGAGPIEVAQGI